MSEELSGRLVDVEAGLTRFAQDGLSCLELTRLSGMKTTLDRAKIYLTQDSKQLASMLIEKAERAFTLFEIGIHAEKESTQIKLCQIEESEEQRIHPAKQFTLLSQEIQNSRFTHSNNPVSEQHKNELAEQKPEADLQSFKQYQDMFEKMALDRLLAKVMQQIPENAGPLNPERLVIRSFKALQEISPEYLSRLISYYESLLILQTVNNSLK